MATFFCGHWHGPLFAVGGSLVIAITQRLGYRTGVYRGGLYQLWVRTLFKIYRPGCL